jgi:hypothetical protein
MTHHQLQLTSQDHSSTLVVAQGRGFTTAAPLLLLLLLVAAAPLHIQ